MSRPGIGASRREGAGPAAARPVVRSPADVWRMVVAAAFLVGVLLAGWLFGDALIAFTAELLRGVDAVADWVLEGLLVATRVLAVVVAGALITWVLVGRRWRFLGTVAAAAALAPLLTAALDRLVTTDDGPQLAPVDVPAAIEAASSPTAIAALTAGLTAAAPWLDRRWRRAGWALVAGVLAAEVLGAPVSFTPALALSAGWFCGAGVLVVLGAPSRRPDADAVIAGLREVGEPLQRLEAASVDARGSTPYFGVDAAGGRMFVKVLGADERSADLLFRLYRRVQPRDLGDERPFESLRRSVEHEALASLAASSLGIRTPALRAFATAEPNGYVLAYEAIPGTSLDRADPHLVDDAVLGETWDLVDQLRRHRIAHRDLRLANLFLDDSGRVWLIDFGFSELAASDLLLATDVAELIASSSLRVGDERAVAQAARHVDPGTLARALQRLQPWALSGATRTALRSRPGMLDDLRNRVRAIVAASTPGT